MSGWGKTDDKTSAGTIALSTAGAVTGTSTVFTTQAAVGDILTANSIDFRITAIASNTAATVVNADAPGTAIVAQSAGAAYTLSEKPSGLIKANAVGGFTSETVFGVDENEMAANTDIGAGHAGWVHVRTNGSRKISETLVALSKNGITGDAEDTEFEDFLISITTQPADSTKATGQAESFAVVSTISGTGGTQTFQWQLQTGGTGSFGNISNGGVYSTATTATLNISDNTGLGTNKYRCVISATGADDVTSTAATLTES
jgi:hypothetical protein